MWRYLFLIFLSSSATAQTQQGYTSDRPNIIVDRSVLEDLKGYEPPPMFGDDETIPPPSAPQLTAPKAETLLGHPVQNFRVLTERNSQTKTEKPIVKPPVSKPQKSEKKPTIIPTKKEPPKEVKKVVVPPAPTATSIYKPKANPTMPAVPPIHVESSALPALPMPNADADKISQPSIGERIIDAALERQIESDNEKIKDKITKEKDTKKKIEKSKDNKKSVVRIPNNSLEFQVGQMDLTDKMETHIRKSILPEITNDLNARIQILSFATSPDNSESTARRISLTRALSVRDYLKKMNIDVSRIDVRALVSDNSIPPNRVDIVLLK